MMAALLVTAGASFVTGSLTTLVLVVHLRRRRHRPTWGIEALRRRAR